MHDSGVLHPVWHHVVYVLHKDKVGTLLVEVFNQGTMSARPEHQFTVFIANRIVLLVYSDDVGVVLLL